MTFKFDVIMLPTTGLPKDQIVNTWHFDEVGGPQGNYENVADMLTDFYQTIDEYFPDEYIADAALVRAYNLDDPEPRAPVFDGSFSIVPGAGTPLPGEVALCLTMRGEYESGEPQARKRNRKYIGPLLASIVDGEGRPSGNFPTDLAAAASTMLAAANASLSWRWRGYSPTDGSSFPLIGGWIDNAFDTQRRRGQDPNSRLFWN